MKKLIYVCIAFFLISCGCNGTNLGSPSKISDVSSSAQPLSKTLVTTVAVDFEVSFLAFG